MKLLSLNIGQPKKVVWKEKTIETSIFKYPVEGRKAVSLLNIEGDKQADLRFHGGRDKAIYAYAKEHYDAWKGHINRAQWNFGLFGENLTTEGLEDSKVNIGDIYQVGTVLIQATQPRIPCFKLNVCFEREDMTTLFYNFKRYGIYFRVLEEGILQKGDAIELVERSPYSISIVDIVDSFTSKGQDKKLLQDILDIPILPDGIRKNFLSFQ